MVGLTEVKGFMEERVEGKKLKGSVEVFFF